MVFQSPYFHQYNLPMQDRIVKYIIRKNITMCQIVYSNLCHGTYMKPVSSCQMQYTAFLLPQAWNLLLKYHHYIFHRTFP
jgi:hypothetical protein